LRKMPIFGLFRHFDPGSYRGFFRKNGQKWPFSPKLAKNRVFGHNTPFWGILGLFGPSGARWRRGFTSTPSGRGLPGAWEGLPDPLRGPGTGGPGTGVTETSGIGIPGNPLPRGRPRGALRTPVRGPGHRHGGGFTSTPRGGAPRFPAGVPGIRGPGGVPGDLPGGLFPALAPEGPQTPFSAIPGNRGRSSPREAEEAVGRGRRAPRGERAEAGPPNALPDSSIKGDEQTTWGYPQT